MKKYKITLNEKQIRLVKVALEEYFRTGMGQFDMTAERLSMQNVDFSPENPNHKWIFDKFINTRDDVHEILRCIERILRLAGQPKTEEMLIAEDIWDVIKHQLWLDSEHRNEWCVDSREPFGWSGEELPKIERIE